MAYGGREVELEVLRVAHGGVAVAELDGRVVFVADTIPGERVLARLTDERHERFWRAETLRVLRASSDRQEHVWAAASLDRPPERRAGGAEFGHIAPARQRTLKTEVLRDALVRIGGLTVEAVDALAPEVAAVPGQSDGTRSRTRVRLQVDGRGRVGPYAARSHRVVPVDDLPLAVEELADLLPARARGRSLELVRSAAGPAVIRDGQDPPPVTELAGGRRFTMAARGFWQVHPAAPEILQAAVREALDGIDPEAEHLDLYGGVGLLAAAIAAAGGARVTTVESDRAASAHAAANLADLGVRAVPARVDRFLADPVRRPGSAIVLDPPRSGAGADVVRAIAESEPDRVVYVACDPVALARDLRTFAEAGWHPTRIAGLDLFPNTHHLEAVATLRRG